MTVFVNQNRLFNTIRYNFVEMCVESLNTLGDHGLVHMDEGFDLRPSGV